MADKRLIDANKLTRWLETNKSNVNPLDYNTRATYAECITMVNAMETIDAVPVVHGRWVRANDEQAYFDVEYVCSGCQFVVAVSGIGTPILYGYKFCPHCGLPMDAKDMDVPTKDGGAADGSD